MEVSDLWIASSLYHTDYKAKMEYGKVPVSSKQYGVSSISIEHIIRRGSRI